MSYSVEVSHVKLLMYATFHIWRFFCARSHETSLFNLERSKTIEVMNSVLMCSDEVLTGSWDRNYSIVSHCRMLIDLNGAPDQ